MFKSNVICWNQVILLWNNLKMFKYYQIMHHLYQVTKTENPINLFLKFQEAQQKEQKVSIGRVWIWTNVILYFYWNVKTLVIDQDGKAANGWFFLFGSCRLQRREFTADTKCFLTPKIPIIWKYLRVCTWLLRSLPGCLAHFTVKSFVFWCSVSQLSIIYWCLDII